MLYLDMKNLENEIHLAKENNQALFYNTQGSKKAYQLGVKHINATEYLGLTLSLPNGDLQVRKEFLLVDFEKNVIIKISKGMRITPIKLKFL
ncbi:MAG: hypothetical protein COA44_14745 [Arcobacter sp.]|nr:MAG: hypothetical protein COA44_14745 [Arcobacter sp.]